MANYYSLGGGMGDFSAMWEPETLKDAAIAVGVGAAAQLLGGKALSMLGAYVDPLIDDAATKEYVKDGLAVLVGFLGATYLHQFNQPAAFALAGGMAGTGLAKMVRQLAGLDSSYGLGDSGMGRASVELQRALANPAVYGRLPLQAALVTPASRDNGLNAALVPSKWQSFMT